MLKDLRYAARGLRRQPGFTFVAAVTIALGIGASTAVFSVVNSVLLRPLPYRDSQRLVLVWSELRTRNVPDFPFPIPDVRDLRQDVRSFDAVAGITPPGRVPIGGDTAEPEQVRVGGVTTNLFSILGARILVGRDFVDDDGAPQPPPGPGAAAGAAPARRPVMAIISYPLFQRRYGADPSVVGKTIELGNGRAEIVGVLAPGFELLFPPRTGIAPLADIYTALRLDFDNGARNAGVLRVIARLTPGVSLVAASTELEGFAATMRERFAPKKNAGLHYRAVPMHEELVSEARPWILTLVGAVAFVLLIACANVANLLVVRAASRERELVIRAAIGGSRAHLVRQMLAESLLLAGIGALLGLLLAQEGIELLLAMAPARLPRLDAIGIDPTVLAFTAAATLVTAIVCGIVPALRASRPDIVDVLRASGRTPSLVGGRRLRQIVVVAEVTLSFVLLVAAGLMVRSFMALERTDPGFDPSHVLTFVLPARAPDTDARAAFIRDMTSRLAALPGVVNVSTTAPLPLDGGTANIPWATEQAGSVDPSAFRQANFFQVRPGYFETMKTALREGRTFTEDDNKVDHAARVVVDEMLAARAFPNASAVGKRLLVRNLRANGPGDPFNDTVEIIGVVSHQRHESIATPGRESIYFVDAYLQFGANKWVVRTGGDPSALASAVRAAAAELDPRTPVSDVQPMQAYVDRSMAPIRFTTTLIGIFGIVAIVMAAVGLYGVLATIVRQRTAEIGMRLVFGAPRSSIASLIVAEGLRLSAAGLVIGIAGALAVTRVLRSLLVGVGTMDPITFATLVALFVAIAACASWVPAWRASRLDPIVALRDE
ncbi:MAG TPA: ABC transporter permease [Vicinamibacterales bacterium]|nr:ABC transporter permease [Vicinamibacterales bacterium]